MASPPQDKNSNSPSPPPPPSPSSSTSPPPSSSSSSSPPPPSSSQSPPPPAKASAPPPENDGQSRSPPPPPKNSDSPPSNNSPPPPSDNSNSSPPPPPPPPPPVSSNSSPSRHSPPPPLPHRTPSSSTSGSSSGKSSSTNQAALIAGVAAGAGLLLIIMILLLVCCCRKKKRKPHDQMHYYSDNYHGNKIGSNYYNSGQHANWNAAGNGEHAVMMPPPPGSISSAQWPAVPPPPPPQVVSSEMSSTGYSGPHHAPLPPPHPALALGFNKSTFTYEDLAAATGGFAKANLLGQGGFGYVHKGVLPNGKEIAVKSLKSGSGQGEREFQAEVDIISRVHHRHLVSLVGYCIADSQRMLVYEFVPNSSLEHHLYGKGVQAMDFPTRLKIALGSAKGFAYLHEDCHPRIIHRDIKAANILLDDNFEAMVADFGLAKLSNDTHTHVSTRIMGTFGYLAPEYASSGKLTEKSDVYSYGVVLLELITGRRPVDISSDDDSLVDWARPILVHAIEGGSYEELVDPRLENNYDPQEMLRMVACAAACIRHSARRRPRMSQIVRALEGDVSLEDLIEGVKPGHSSVFGSSGSSEYDGSYSTEIKRFRKIALASQEFTSSEHGVNSSSGGESQEIRSRGSRRNSP